MLYVLLIPNDGEYATNPMNGMMFTTLDQDKDVSQRSFLSLTADDCGAMFQCVPTSSARRIRHTMSVIHKVSSGCFGHLVKR